MIFKNLFSQVYVLQPKKMEFIPSVVEAQIETPLSLPLAVASCIYMDADYVQGWWHPDQLLPFASQDFTYSIACKMGLEQP